MKNKISVILVLVLALSIFAVTCVGGGDAKTTEGRKVAEKSR